MALEHRKSDLLPFIPRYISLYPASPHPYQGLISFSLLIFSTSQHPSNAPPHQRHLPTLPQRHIREHHEHQPLKPKHITIHASHPPQRDHLRQSPSDTGRLLLRHLPRSTSDVDHRPDHRPLTSPRRAAALQPGPAEHVRRNDQHLGIVGGSALRRPVMAGGIQRFAIAARHGHRVRGRVEAESGIHGAV